MIIKKINTKKANKIVSDFKPLGLFYLKGENGSFIGIDNKTGDAWTEEFKTLKECKDWLEGRKVKREFIWILDFAGGQVVRVEKEKRITPEKTIEKLGFRLKDIEWLITEQETPSYQ